MKEIKFTTKFELGQKAVAYDSLQHKLIDIEIDKINFSTDGIDTIIFYRDGITLGIYREDEVYTSREEFIAQL